MSTENRTKVIVPCRLSLRAFVGAGFRQRQRAEVFGILHHDKKDKGWFGLPRSKRLSKALRRRKEKGNGGGKDSSS